MARVYTLTTTVVVKYEKTKGGGSNTQEQRYPVCVGSIDTSWDDVESVLEYPDGDRDLVVRWKDGRQTTIKGRFVVGCTEYSE
jgi:hypothetical protein